MFQKVAKVRSYFDEIFLAVTLKTIFQSGLIKFRAFFLKDVKLDGFRVVPMPSVITKRAKA